MPKNVLLDLKKKKSHPIEEFHLTSSEASFTQSISDKLMRTSQPILFNNFQVIIFGLIRASTFRHLTIGENWNVK